MYNIYNRIREVIIHIYINCFAYFLWYIHIREHLYFFIIYTKHILMFFKLYSLFHIHLKKGDYDLHSHLSSIIPFLCQCIHSTIKLIFYFDFSLNIVSKVQLFYAEDRSQQTKLSDVKNEHVQPYNSEATMKDLLPTWKGKTFSSKLNSLYSFI